MLDCWYSVQETKRIGRVLILLLQTLYSHLNAWIFVFLLNLFDCVPVLCFLFPLQKCRLSFGKVELDLYHYHSLRFNFPIGDGGWLLFTTEKLILVLCIINANFFSLLLAGQILLKTQKRFFTKGVFRVNQIVIYLITENGAKYMDRKWEIAMQRGAVKKGFFCTNNSAGGPIPWRLYFDPFLPPKVYLDHILSIE